MSNDPNDPDGKHQPSPPATGTKEWLGEDDEGQLTERQERPGSPGEEEKK
jgi:hypothetical protein